MAKPIIRQFRGITAIKKRVPSFRASFEKPEKKQKKQRRARKKKKKAKCKDSNAFFSFYSKFFLNLLLLK